MLKAGITGGIGSGKSTVCQVFEALGIPVFYADTAARFLMEHDAALISDITRHFGPDAYQGNKLNRKFIAERVFGNPAELQALNALTHPAVFRYSEQWMNSRKSPYVIKEAAIFFESGSNQQMDLMIGVTAPLELRISRTIQRDHISREQVLERISRQMDETEKMRLCDFVIHNDEQQMLLPQILSLHQVLLQRAAVQ